MWKQLTRCWGSVSLLCLPSATSPWAGERGALLKSICKWLPQSPAGHHRPPSSYHGLPTESPGTAQGSVSVPQFPTIQSNQVSHAWVHFCYRRECTASCRINNSVASVVVYSSPSSCSLCTQGFGAICVSWLAGEDDCWMAELVLPVTLHVQV